MADGDGESAVDAETISHKNRLPPRPGTAPVYFDWGIRFGEPYILQEKSARKKFKKRKSSLIGRSRR